MTAALDIMRDNALITGVHRACESPTRARSRSSVSCPSSRPWKPAGSLPLRRWRPRLRRSFGAPTMAQARAWLRHQRGAAHTLVAAPTGSGKTLAAFLAAIDQLVRQGVEAASSGRNPGRLCLAAQSFVERHPAQSAGAADRHPGRIAASGTACRRYPRLGPNRRHARRRTRQDAPPAAPYRRDHAGIALHPARPNWPHHAEDDADRDRQMRSTPGRRTSAARIWRSHSNASRRFARARCNGSACRPPKSRLRRSRISLSAPPTRASRIAKSSMAAISGRATSPSKSRSRRSRP